MRFWLPQLFSVWLLGTLAWAETPRAEPAGEKPAPAAAAATTVRSVYVIPVREQIGSAVLYVVRRGIKEAIEQKADAVILDMDTPGGALDDTFEIMEAIARFPGLTLTYVNSEAISAGAFLSATTNEIWFAPNGIIGAAAPVSMGGQEVEATMRLKVVSYLKARVRATSEGKGGYRGAVISAMIDANQELKVGDKVLKEKGELLSLTASEAAQTYGDPPQALLSAGTAATLDELIARRFGPGKPAVTQLHLTWSEEFAAWLNVISPMLLGLGLLALFIEFKTPGFGVFGVLGIACLAVVFLSNYVAGLSGHEPMLVFGLGVVLVAIEIFFLPGAVVFALGGLVLMFGSLVWSMADLWPNEPIAVAWSGDAFARPLLDLGLGIAIAVVLGALVWRFLPQGWFFRELAVAMPIKGSAQIAGSDPEVANGLSGLIGKSGVAATALFPSGQVEIEGRRFEARLEVGSAAAGTRVVVRSASDFGLVVEVAS